VTSLNHFKLINILGKDKVDKENEFRVKVIKHWLQSKQLIKLSIKLGHA